MNRAVALTRLSDLCANSSVGLNATIYTRGFFSRRDQSNTTRKLCPYLRCLIFYIVHVSSASIPASFVSIERFKAGRMVNGWSQIIPSYTRYHVLDFDYLMILPKAYTWSCMVQGYLFLGLFRILDRSYGSLRLGNAGMGGITELSM